MAEQRDTAGNRHDSPSSLFPKSACLAPFQPMDIMQLDLPHGLETKKFLVWWKDDKERRLCTLEQAIGAYISTFPGRLHFLLVELLKPHV